MSTYTQILYQIVFGSKNYTPFISVENDSMLFAYIAGILKNKLCHSYIVGGANNHIHIITHIHPSQALSSLVKEIKMGSQKLILDNRHLFPGFPGWQVGYGAFTYNIKSKSNLIRYVKNQREHHMSISYMDELRKMLREHDINFVDEYLIT